MIETARAQVALRVALPRWAVADAGALIALTAVIGIVFWIAKAPLYNPLATIDPWLYTALFTNFGFIYHHFWNTYYASRLPWVIPGLFFHHFFSTHVAYFLLHGVFFLSGGVALFILVRRCLGRLPAFVAYSALLGSQLYYNAQTWDYLDGAVVTYLLVALACGVTSAVGPRRLLALFGAGFFLAAAVSTNLFVIALAVGTPLLYFAVNPIRGHGRRMLKDAVTFALGAGSLLLGCCIFASRHGGGFWFLEPQIRAAHVIDAGKSRPGGHDWAPRLIAPLFVLGFGALAIPGAMRRHPDERRRWRFAIGAYGYLLIAEIFFVVYELAGAAVLEYPFYESLLLPALAIAGAAVVYAISIAVRGVGWRFLLLLLSTGAALLPLLLIYRRDTQELVGSTGSWITLGVVGVTIAFWLLSHAGRLPKPASAAAAIVVVTLLIFGVNFSFASSPDVFNYGVSNAENGNVYDAGMDLVSFMRNNAFQSETPFFWYSTADGAELRELQSLYFFGYTYLGVEMPMIDRDFLLRERLNVPRMIVLLCRRLECRGGPQALRAHGYRLREVGRRRLVSGKFAAWVRVFRAMRTAT
jgi:hypothetical protein